MTTLTFDRRVDFRPFLVQIIAVVFCLNPISPCHVCAEKGPMSASWSATRRSIIYGTLVINHDVHAYCSKWVDQIIVLSSNFHIWYVDGRIRLTIFDASDVVSESGHAPGLLAAKKLSVESDYSKRGVIITDEISMKSGVKVWSAWSERRDRNNSSNLLLNNKTIKNTNATWSHPLSWANFLLSCKSSLECRIGSFYTPFMQISQTTGRHMLSSAHSFYGASTQ